LFNLTKLIAPFTPFISEHIYQELISRINANDKANKREYKKESVHLESWPEYKEELINEKVLSEMEVVRKIVELGLAKRAEEGIKVRQPLNKFSIFNFQFSIDYINLIRDELNIKNIICEKGTGDLSVELDTEITPELKQEGLLRELVRTINQMRKKTGLTIQDRIEIKYFCEDKELKKVFEKFEEELKKQTLADELILINEELPARPAGGEKIKINNIELGLRIEKKVFT